TLDRGQADAYLDLLEKEVALFAEELGDRREAVQLHFGGGTPNFFGPEQIDRLRRLIERYFTFTSDAEKSVELDPRRLTPEHIEAFARMGVNRASFGIQDCDPEVQQAIHRIQPHTLNEDAMRTLRANGYTSVNIDLIYGLPLQTPEQFGRTLDQVLELEPDRFAVFNYAHVPWMKPAQKLLERNPLPSPRTKLELLQLCIERLTAAGFVYIGMDHFARPEDELVQAQNEKTLQRNFQGYSTRSGVEICGFGISSISQGEYGFRQNLKDMTSYRQALEQDRLPMARGYLLTPEDRLRGDVIHRLMCDLSLDFDAFGKKHGVDFREYFSDALEQLDEAERDGLVVREPNALIVTERGRLFIRNLAMCFDAYLGTGAGQRYSRTV
ncbi:MAG: oxygen-independent coproporphyrinogen III oxidase, partial [Opitutales bacterium]